MDWRLESFVDEHLPKNQKEFSRDAVIILMKMLWKEAKKAERANAAEEERERLHGPMFI
jgi:hypothetical protein